MRWPGEVGCRPNWWTTGCTVRRVAAGRPAPGYALADWLRGGGIEPEFIELPPAARDEVAVIQRTCMQSHKEIDTRGLNCPLPILKAKKALTDMQSGQLLKVVSTDPGSVRDFQAFSQQTGNELVEQTRTWAGSSCTSCADLDVVSQEVVHPR